MILEELIDPLKGSMTDGEFEFGRELLYIWVSGLNLDYSVSYSLIGEWYEEERAKAGKPADEFAEYYDEQGNLTAEGIEEWKLVRYCQD